MPVRKDGSDENGNEFERKGKNGNESKLKCCKSNEQKKLISKSFNSIFSAHRTEEGENHQLEWCQQQHTELKIEMHLNVEFCRVVG